MPWEPDPDAIVRWGWVIVALSALLFIVSALGEILGWWNLIGEILGPSVPGEYGREAVRIGMSVGAVVGILVSFSLLMFTAGRRQVTALHADLQDLGTGVWIVEENVRSVDTNVPSVDGNVRSVHEAIAGEEGMIQELDEIQVELDRQTGVLGEQLEVLSQIRDGVA